MILFDEAPPPQLATITISGQGGVAFSANTGSRFDDLMASNLSGTGLFSDNFASDLLSDWDIVDESEESGLASWVIQNDGMPVQGANTLSYAGSDIAKLGTYILYSIEDKVAS